MKKCTLFIVLVLIALFTYGHFFNNKKIDVEKLEKNESMVLEAQFDLKYDATERSYSLDTLMPDCDSEDEIICALEIMVKCSINPIMDTCTKDRVPDFVFMQDDNLGRPTEISYKITKVNPIDSNTLEIHTTSECNGTWFGLCKGNVIYVLDNIKGYFRVKDVYAIN